MLNRVGELETLLPYGVSQTGRECVAGRPGFADLSPCVSAAQWFESHLRWPRPAGWRTYRCRFDADSLIPDGAAIGAIRTPPKVMESIPRFFPSTSSA